MKRSRFSDEQIIGILKEQEAVSCPPKVEPLFGSNWGYLGWLESDIRMRTA